MQALESIYSIYQSHSTICTDTRKLVEGALFFALKGDNFNGNEFALKALEEGCAYAIIDEEQYATHTNCILVEDVLETLQSLANYHRKQLGLPIIAVTGSNGKTTTKELIFEVLKTTKNVFKTPGNFNNHIGLPLSILQLNQDHEIAILEMGDSQMGDVELLCEIAEPEYGFITNIGKDHIGGFGSMDNNILAKKEIIDYLAQTHGTFFLNTEDELVQSLIPQHGLTTILYGRELIELAPSTPFLNFTVNSKKYTTHLVGDYNIHNLRLAYAIGKEFGISETNIIEALCNYEPKSNRSELVKTQKNTLILDAYNANPSSVEVALQSFAKTPNPNKWVIIGDMLELGEISEREHQNITETTQQLGFTNAIFVGTHFAHTEQIQGFHYFSTKEDAVDFIESQNIHGATILLKASRSLRLETLVDFL